MACGLETLKRYKNWFNPWQASGQKKVVLSVDSRKKLFEIKAKADKLKLPNKIIEDAGMTEISKGTVTCLAIGPAPSKTIDKVTGDLPLFK